MLLKICDLKNELSISVLFVATECFRLVYTFYLFISLFLIQKSYRHIQMKRSELKLIAKFI